MREWISIRHDRENEGMSFTELSNKYGVGRSRIHRRAQIEKWDLPNKLVTQDGARYKEKQGVEMGRSLNKSETAINKKNNINHMSGSRGTSSFESLTSKDFDTVSFQLFEGNKYAGNVAKIGGVKVPRLSNGKYQDAYASVAYQIGLLGGTHKCIASACEVSEQTIHNWMKKYPEFKLAWLDGRLLADCNVVNSLYRSAIGYNLKFVESKIVNDKLVITEKLRHYPPNMTAAMYWLNNRQPHLWKSKVEVEPEIVAEPIDSKKMDDLYEAVLREADELFNANFNRAERLGLKLDGEGEDD